MGDRQLFTMERPWVKYSDIGGKPFLSCVPDGLYNLLPHTRPNGDKSYALVNPLEGVYHYDEHRPNGQGRYLILIHPGNWVTDVVGCIAPGLAYKIDSQRRQMVSSSKVAMDAILVALNGEFGHTLNILNSTGAVD